MDEKEARRQSLELMSIAEAAFLTTVDAEGFPQTRALVNLRQKEQYPGLIELFDGHRDDFLVYLGTNESSNKVQQIRGNPKASVYYCKPSEWRGLMLGGKIEIVTDQALKEAIWQDGWEMHWPKGAEDPELTVLKLAPTFARGYYKEGPFEFELSPINVSTKD